MTIKDIANLAGVSISTVSKIVNNKADNINAETRNRVLQIVKEYNYAPYSAARSSSGAKTFLIGVLLKQVSRAGVLESGILETARRRGYQILLCDSAGDEKIELKQITALCRHRVDGVIWEPAGRDSQKFLRYFQEQNIPVSFLGPAGNENSYSLDYVSMGYAAAQKLLEYRHTKIACLTVPGSLFCQKVLEGVRKCLFDHGISYTDGMELSSKTEGLCSRLLSGGFTGIVCTCYSSALLLYKEAERLRYRIPSDLSVVSLLGEDEAFADFPSISGVCIPLRQLAELVCEDLIGRCEQKSVPARSSLPALPLVFNHEDSLAVPPSLRYKKILAAGSIHTDITLKVDTAPVPGTTGVITSSCTSLGGKGANQAVAAARLGHTAVILGKIGMDLDSDVICDTFGREHVLTCGLRRDSRAPAGKAYIHVPRDAESSITILSGANQYLTPEDIRSAEYLFEDCGYCLVSTEIPAETVLQTLQTARKYQGITIVKPAALSSLPEGLLDHTDIFVPNQKEAALLCPFPATVEKQAAFFLEQGCPTVLITLGHRGCYLKTADTARYFPAAAFPVADSTGGADALIAALAVYLTEGYELTAAIRIAMYAAGFCVSRPGAAPAMADRASLENHIRDTEPDLLLSPHTSALSCIS